MSQETEIRFQDMQGRRLTIAEPGRMDEMPRLGDHIHTHQLGTMRVHAIGEADEGVTAITLDSLGALTPGVLHYDPQIGKDRLFVRESAGGTFRGARIFAVQEHVAIAASPVPWDTSKVWPWVVHIDVVLPDQQTGAPRFVTFTMPALGGPGTPEWEDAEAAAVKRLGVHEALESFGPDPHTHGGDTLVCPALLGEDIAALERQLRASGWMEASNA